MAAVEQAGFQFGDFDLYEAEVTKTTLTENSNSRNNIRGELELSANCTRADSTIVPMSALSEK